MRPAGVASSLLKLFVDLLKHSVYLSDLFCSSIGDQGAGIDSPRRIGIERSGGVSAGEQESSTDAGAEFRVGDFLGGG